MCPVVHALYLDPDEGIFEVFDGFVNNSELDTLQAIAVTHLSTSCPTIPHHKRYVEIRVGIRHFNSCMLTAS